MKVLAWVKGLPDYLKNSIKNFKHWKKTLIISSIVVALSIVSFFVYQSGFSYQVILNGEKVGAVKEITIVENALKEVEEEVLEQYGDKAHFENEIKYEKVRVKKDQLLEKKQIVDFISKKAEILKPAAIIVMDGENKLIVESTKDAQQVLDEIKRPYIEKVEEKDNQELLEVSFGQKVNIISKDVSPDEILTKEQAMEKVSQSSEAVQTYQVAKGDSAWNISRAFNMGIRTLEEANPGKDIEKLMPGEKINLFVEQPFIDVKTIEKHIIVEDIKCKVEEKKDSTLYVGQKKVIEEGKKGKKEVTMEITYLNGAEDKRDIIEEKILEEPQTRVVKVGTKARPKVSRKPAPTYKGEIGSAIAKTAMGYRGIPYRSGGSSPSSGFDCSGLTSYVYRQYGIRIPRTSGGQAGLGGYVSRSDLRPGDLVIFPGHVGIYVGGNNFVHAPRTGKRVQVGSLSGYWSGRFRGGRRVY